MGSNSPVSVCLPFFGDSIGGSLISSIYLIHALRERKDVKVVVSVAVVGRGARKLMENGIEVQVWREF